MNTVEFVLKLKDLMSAGMANANARSQAAFNSMNNGLARTQRHFHSTGSSITQLNAKLDALRQTRDLSIDSRQIRAANREMEQLERRRDRLENSGRSRDGGGGMMAGLVSRFAPAAMAAGAAMLATTSISAAMEGKAQQVSFETMAGKKKGGQLFNDLDKFARDSIFGADLYKDAQTMKAFGVETDKVMDRLKRLGDISIGDAQKLNSLSLAYSQVYAGGKLTGQDNLQFINAGWNPLQELSQMTGKSMASFRKAMEDGKISVAMIDQALEHATNKGGTFFEMTQKIGETSFGKFQALQGNFEAFQKDLGNFLMPLASNFMQAANDVLHFLDISRTVPETLISEQAEVNTLVNSITKLNEGNEYRASLISTLQAKYPEFFGNLDIEKTKNQDLLQVLKDVNGEYERKIGLAGFDLEISKNQQEISTLTDMITRFRKESSKDPNDPNDYTNFMDVLSLAKRGRVMHNTPEGLKNLADDLEKDVQNLIGRNSKAKTDRDFTAKTNENDSLISQAQSILSDKKKQEEMWGKNAESKAAELQKEMGVIQRYKKTQDDVLVNQLLLGKSAIGALPADYTKIKELLGVPETQAGPKKGDDNSLNGVTDRANNVTAGGQKTITFNISKFFENLNITAQTMQGGYNDMEAQVKEVMIRVLESANQTIDN